MAQKAATATVDIRSNGSFVQFLTFQLAGEEYGVDILRVQEIRGWTPVTCIPNLPAYVEGVLNLRGTVVPIIDLRARFGLEKIEYGANTVIIVLKIMLGEVGRTVGLIVDGVSDVRNVNADQLKPAPDLGDAVNVEFLKGMAAIEDRMVILLDVDKLLEGDATLISSHVPAGGKAGVSSRS